MSLSKSQNNLDNCPDVFYYDVIMPGVDFTPASLAKFDDNRSQSLMDNPSDYFLSVIRFSIDASVIPLFICPIVLNQPDPNLTPFVVSFMYNNILYSQNVIYVPDDNSSPPPITVPQNTTSSFYYYVYFYSSFINMVNTALTTAFAKLTTAVPSLSSVPPPYYIYDTSTQLISLIVPNIVIAGVNLFLTQYSANGTPALPQNSGTIYMFLNLQLFSFFDGIEAYNYISPSSVSTPIYPDFLMIFRDLKNNYYYPPQNVSNYPITNQTLTSISTLDTTNTAYTDSYTVQPHWFIFTQQYHIVSSWDSLSSIVFITQSIPVQKEYIPTLPFNNNGNIVGSSNRSILADFVPELTLAGEQRERFVYTANVFRLISLNSQIPLYKIDLQLFWTDRLQNLYPMRINYSQVDTIKLMFIKKELVYKNPQNFKFY